MILWVELRKIISDIKAYWFNYIFGNINVLFLFAGLFFAFKINESSNVDRIVFLYGMLIWYFGVHAIDLIAIIIEEELIEGTLEQLLMTKSSLSYILFNRILAQFIFDVVKASFVTILFVFILNIDLRILISIKGMLFILLFVATLVSMFGIGYLIAGMSLVYKRVGAIAQASNNFILYLSGITLSVSTLPPIFQLISKIFPLSWSRIILENILRNQFINIEISNAIMYFTVLSLVWVCIGVVGFTYYQNKAKELGIISSY